MSSAALMLWILGVHILGLGCVAFLMWPALKDNAASDHHSDGDGDDGWGRRPKAPPPPPQRPRGGIPLPDAEPASVRLRDHNRLGDHLPRRERRPAREPGRQPVRTRQRFERH